MNKIYILCLLLLPISASAELLFSEDFDSQDDWAPGALSENSDSLSFTGVVPDGWSFYLTNELWNPDFGEPAAKPSIAITGENSDQVFGGTGKALVKYSESTLSASNNYASDGFLTIDIPPSDEVYVEFRIRFQDGFADDFDTIPSGISQQFLLKLVRVLHYDGPGFSRTKFFSDGYSAPIYIYDWEFNQYGLRNLHSFRCDAQLTNYKCTNPEIIDDYPRNASETASMSANYTDDIFDYDPTIEIPDLVNVGDSLPTSGTVTQEQVFGNVWHKVAFQVKLNTAPGAENGVLRQWLDDQLIVELQQIPWIGNDGDMNAQWNSVSFGGNAHFHFNLEESDPKNLRERWYAIDNIRIHDALPNAPKPPTNLSIQ